MMKEQTKVAKKPKGVMVEFGNKALAAVAGSLRILVHRNC